MFSDFFVNAKHSCIDTLYDKINFLVLHYLYIGFLCFFISGLFYIQPGTQWNYADALFMSTTAVTNTGTNTIDMSDLSVYQLLLQIFGSILGSHVLISWVIVLVRKHYFSKRFQDVLLFNRARHLRERKNRQQSKTEVHRQQQSSLTHSNDINAKRRSILLPCNAENKKGIFPRLPSSVAWKDSFRFHHLFRERKHSTDHDEAAYRKEQHMIYDKLCVFNEEKDPEIDIGRCYKKDPASTPSLHAYYSCHRVSDTDITSNVLLPSTPKAEPSEPNIIFAMNVDKQREEARQEYFENDRSQKDLSIKALENEQDPSRLQRSLYHVNELDEKNSNVAQGNSNPTNKFELTREQRYKIDGVEYQALVFLSICIPIVYFSTAILSTIAMRIYVAADDFAQEALRTTNPSGSIDPWLYSFFTCLSAYNNFGLAPTNTSFAAFVNAPFPLLLASFLIVIGNTGYPALLRFFIWCIYKLLPESRVMDRETLRYLLDHPRRCYTMLFPASQTWWLVCVVTGLTVAEWVVFLATNYWLPVLDGIPWASRVVVGLFQGISTRNAGFTAVNIMILNPGTQIVYIIAMYISVYPVGISIRNSNVYQERELGIYNGDDLYQQQNEEPTKLSRFPTINSVMTTTKRLIPKRPSFYVITQIQRTVAREICWVLIGIFCICIIEAEAIMAPSPITVLTIIYETVSAFGTVGSSAGYPGVTTAQAGSYHILSKLILTLLMYRGCHRGLPSTIDHAVLLPSEQLNRREEREYRLRQQYAELIVQQSLDYPYPRWRSRTMSLS